MTEHRLLIAIEVLDYLRTVRRRDQVDLMRRFREIAAAPSHFADLVEHDSVGRPIGVHIFGKYAIKFWNDFADRQVKILDLHLADRPR